MSISSIESVVYLCRCAIHEEIPDRKIVESMDLRSVYEAAQRHMLSSAVGLALQSAGIEDALFDKAVSAACWKNLILNAEKKAVFSKLSEAGVWFMPLKGTVLREWYPNFAMRESADCDILFDKSREEDVKTIMLGLGYDLKSYGTGHHDVYLKPPVTNMQMHVALFGTGFEKRLNDYFEGVKDRLVNKSDYELCFTPEDFYIYFLAHNHRDYSNRGTGLRSVLDTFVFLQKFQGQLDWRYIDAETEKLEIQEYERQNRSLAQHLFGNETLTEEDRSMLRYLASSGVYGTLSNSVNNKVERLGGGFVGKLRYMKQRLFLPMDVVEHSFPVFYQYKILLPFLPVYRAVLGMWTNRNKLLQEWKLLRTHKSDD